MSRRNEIPNIARIGALIGNPVRAHVISSLMDGSEQPASSLANQVGATPQAVSAHLSSLVAGGLLAVRPRMAFAHDFRCARRCYDHVAGRLGVALCDFALKRRYVVADGTGASLTTAGNVWLDSLDLRPPEGLRRPLVRFCEDWSERRAHLAGWLGAALCRGLEESGAVRRVEGSRALLVTPTGYAALRRRFALEWPAIERPGVR